MAGPILRKVKEKGLLWATQKSASRLVDYAATPFWLVYRMRAIRSARVATRLPRTPKQVVFVSDRLHLRATKLAYALKKIGLQVILLHRDALTCDASEYFTEVHQYRNPWEALLLASRYTPVAYHIFSNWNFAVAATLMRYKPGKIVFDNYDLLTGMVKDEVLRRDLKQSELEQYCYVNADGLCCRDLRPQYLKRHLGYHLPRTILFPEYCWPEEKFQRMPKLTNGIHVVYAGNLDLNPESPVGYQYDLAVLLSQNGIHFHIYPSFLSHVAELKRIMSHYLADHSGVQDFVHIHNTISPDRLTEELSRYHYGLLISTKQVDYGDDHNTSFEHVSDYFGAAKIFDYMEAGLFTFIQNARFLRFFLERHHNGKVVRNLHDIVTHCKSEPFTEPVIPESQRLLFNISRLTTFYLSLP